MSSIDAMPLSATPSEGQVITHNHTTYNTVKEGLAYILVPVGTKTSQDPQSKGKVESDSAQRSQSVFYNPIQQFNRDLSVLAIKAFGEDLCDRRRAKWARNYEKLGRRKANKQERKRKREAEAVENVSKAQRVEDGSSLPQDTLTSSAIAGAQDDTLADSSMREAIPDSISVIEASNDVQASIDEASVAQPTTSAKEGPPFRILDALSATGLRALRYAKEIPFATSIIANDMDRKAVKSIELHLEYNGLKDRIQATASNALAHMYGVAHPPLESHGPTHASDKYDVIDLDPYGTAVPFLDAAVQALHDGGLLCVTCTDSGVFASCGYAEKTFSLYGGMPVKGPHCHETGLRLVLHAVASAAARYGIAIEPLLSLSIDFYVRLFIRIRRSPADVKFLSGKTMIVHECDHGCGAWSTQLIGRTTKRAGDERVFKHTIEQSPSSDRLCQHCGSKMHIAGPMWAGPLHHAGFVQKIIDDAQTADKEVYKTLPRVEGVLTTALEELLNSHYLPEAGVSIPKTAPEQLDQQPFFLYPAKLAKVLHAQSPSEAQMKGALRHAGYNATRSHCKPGSVKTNASWTAIWEIMREWVRQKSPVAKEKYQPGSPGWKIMGFDKSELSDAPVRTNGHVTATEDEAAETNGKTGTKQQIIFDETLGKDRPGKKLVRYQLNPRDNWGPMSRAG